MSSLPSVRVVNYRSQDPDFRAEPGEFVIPVDRSSKLFGNPLPMKVASLAERERVIEAFQKILDADTANDGPMNQELRRIARKVLETGQPVSMQCACAPTDCHGDRLAARFREILIELGPTPMESAKVAAPSTAIGERQKTLDTALLAAAMRFDPIATSKSLRQGANPNARQGVEGPSALMRACERGHDEALECARLLLDAGADPNIQNQNGHTATMWAAGQGNRGAIEMLVAAGADLGIEALNGQRCEHFSAGSMNPPFMEWMAGYAAAWRDSRELSGSTPSGRSSRSPSL